jgi:hypothetical protein
MDRIAAVVVNWCRQGGTYPNQYTAVVNAETISYNAQAAWHEAWQNEAGASTVPPFAPQLFMVTKVFYLRGLRYIYNDSEARAALLKAALNTRIKTGNTPAAAGGAAPAAPAADSGAPDQAKQLSAQMASLITAINDLNTAMSSGNNVGITTSFGRATAQGIEIDAVFDRPLAFGFEPVAEGFVDEHTKAFKSGVQQICEDFGVKF